MMDMMPSPDDEFQAKVEAKRKWIANSLQGDCDDLVRKWRPIHARMIDDERQVEGIDAGTQPTKDNATAGEPGRDPPTLKITASRTAIAAARLADMLFPHADQPWDIAPADEPHIPEEDLQPMEPAQVESILKERADEMRKLVKDQLQETRFVPKARRMLEDAARIGWGVLKGPVMGVRKRKRHRGQLAMDGQSLTMVSVTEVQEESRPDIEYVDPWKFVADLAPTIEEAEKAYEFRLMSERDVRELRGMPGFDDEAIQRLLKQKPTEVSGSPILGTYARKNIALGLQENLREVYVVIEYNGPMRKEWAEQQEIETECGCQTVWTCDALQVNGQPWMFVDDGSPLPMVQIFFCQGEILKFKESPIENDSRLPYYVYTFHRMDDTFAGGGIPYLMRSMDRVIQASFRMGLHNASVSSGPLVFLRRGKVTPADGRGSIRGPKTFYVDGEQSMKDLVYTQIIDNNAQQYLALLDKALALSDEIINLPLIAQGSPSAVTQTASGLAMQLNAQNIFQKRLAMNAEDSVIVPLIDRMIEWNLAYGDAARIGGDFKVVPRTNALLVKDMQAQRLQAATMMTADPRFAPYIDNYGLLKKNFEILEIATDGIVLPEQEAREREQAMQQQAPDPMVEIKQAELQIKQAKIDSDAQIAQGDQELRAMEAQMKERVAQMGVDQAYAKLALDENITLADIQAKIQQIREAEATKRTKIGVDARVAAEKLAADERKTQQEIAVEFPSVRLA